MTCQHAFAMGYKIVLNFEATAHVPTIESLEEIWRAAGPDNIPDPNDTLHMAWYQRGKDLAYNHKLDYESFLHLASTRPNDY